MRAEISILEKIHKNNELRSTKVRKVKRRYQLQSKEKKSPHLKEKLKQKKTSKLKLNVSVGLRYAKNSIDITGYLKQTERNSTEI